MAKSKGQRYSEEERRELVRLYRESGYGITRFCQEMELSYATLRRWLGEEAPDAVSFVEVETGPEGRGADDGALRVWLPNGIVCELGAGADPSVAAGWIRELAQC